MGWGLCLFDGIHVMNYCNSCLLMLCKSRHVCKFRCTHTCHTHTHVCVCVCVYIYEPLTKGLDLKWDTLPQNQTPSKLFSVLPLESGMFQVTISIIKKWFWSKCVHLLSQAHIYIWACDKRCSCLTRVCLYTPIYFCLTTVTQNCGCFYSVCIDE